MIAIGDVRNEDTGFTKLRDGEKLVYLEIPFTMEELAKHNRVWPEILN